MMKHNYFDGPGKPMQPEEKKPMASDHDGDEPVETITVHKKPEGGHSFRTEDGEHNSVGELAKSLEEKYGEDKVEGAEEKVSPGVHKKAGDYLSKVMDE